MGNVALKNLGSLRMEAKLPPNGVTAFTDEGKELGGLGENGSPLDYLSLALGSCMVSIMSWRAMEKGLDLTGTTAVVKRTMTADFRVDKFTVEIDCPVPVDEEMVAYLEKMATECPIRRSLLPEIKFDHHFKWKSK